ncbi:MAG: autotransporter domain-containing protein [Gammaproteobacteria bacterium]|nr:autotransporter domain-containing protein [Gammaproteobacteria bacterium]
MKHPIQTFPMLALALAVSQASYAQVTAVDDTVTTTVDNTVIINVLANDSSTVGNETMFVEWEGTLQTGYGSVVIGQSNELIYTPNEGYTGPDQFTYTALDQEGFGYGGTATVFITVAPATTDNGIEGAIESLVQGTSNKRTASMLETVCAKASENGALGTGLSDDLNASCLALLDAVENNPDSINQMVGEIAPEEILAQRTLMAGMIRNHSSRLYQFQDSLRPGSQGDAVSVNGNGMMLNSYKGGAAGEEAPRWGVFGSVNTDQAEHDQTEFESGYEYDAYGFTLGVDHGLRPDLHVGAALNWLTYDLEYDNNGGTLDSDLYTFTGYLSWFLDKLSVDAQVGYTAGDFSTERNIESFSTVALGDTDSNQYNVSAQVDYTMGFDALTTRPYLRVDYLATQIDGYNEEGGAGWAMEIGDQELNITEVSLGLDTTYALSFDWGVMVPGIKLAAVSESSSDYAPVVFHLMGDASSDGIFSLQPDTEDSMFYQVDLSAVFQLKNGIATFFSVQNTLGYEDLSAFQVVGGFNIEI